MVQVALHGGAPNKNIGDAFLLVWKFPKGCTVEDIAKVTAVPDAAELEVSGCEAPAALTCCLICLQTCRMLAGCSNVDLRKIVLVALEALVSLHLL